MNPDPVNNVVPTPPAVPEDKPVVITTQEITPSVNTVAASVMPEVPPAGPVRKSRGKWLLIFLLLLVFLSVGAGAGGAYLVAYEKIKLVKYPEVQTKVSAFVQSVPFMPKTPKFLLTKSALVHQSVTKESFDISMAVDSNDLVSSIGSSGFDLQAKGAVDYGDPENVKITVSGSVTKDFSFDLVKPDKMLYFKINKLPQILLTAFGFKSSDFDSVLGKWVYYDTTPLDTEARKSIEKDKVHPLSEQFVYEELAKYLDEKILAAMKVDEVKEGDLSLYKVSMVADAGLIDHLGKKVEENRKTVNNEPIRVLGASTDKLSDVVKSLTWEIYIDTRTYYTRKVIMKADIESDSFSGGSLYLGTSSGMTGKSKAKVAFAAAFSDFGKVINADKPASSMSWEEFLNLISGIVQKQYGSYFGGQGNAYASANDARRQSDLSTLRSALELYRSDNGKYPATVKVLIPTYISSVPKDPDGGDYYYSLAKNGKEYEVCAILESTATAAGSPCTNKAYNYGLKNP